MSEPDANEDGGTEWVPVLEQDGRPRYRAFFHALERDIANGHVKPGMQLLPQREMAQRLGLSLGTISKAYEEAAEQGLISGEVGRGTFVKRRRSEPLKDHNGVAATINLALNVPPYTGEDKAISAMLNEIVADGEMANLLGYLPHQGLRHHREAMAIWLRSLGIDIGEEQIFITHGSQHGLSIALSLVISPGQVVLTERFTYSGMIALSAQNEYKLHGVETDDDGLVPESLDRAFHETGAKALFCTPTLQTPTGSVMPQSRRAAIADIVRRYDAYLLEDDAYAFLFDEPPRSISSMIPERSFYVTSFAKCLAPGLRIAAMIAPASFRDRFNNAIRATGWMATPIMAEVVSRLIHNGELRHQVELKRKKATVRNEIVSRVLSPWLPPLKAQPGFHRWLKLPAGRTLIALLAQAAQAGITLAPPGALQQVDRTTLGVRLCLGHPSSEEELERAMHEIKRILETTEMISFI